jgi:hypothetical protein
LTEIAEALPDLKSEALQSMTKFRDDLLDIEQSVPEHHICATSKFLDRFGDQNAEQLIKSVQPLAYSSGPDNYLVQKLMRCLLTPSISLE